jgi:hypothetical protein
MNPPPRLGVAGLASETWDSTKFHCRIPPRLPGCPIHPQPYRMGGKALSPAGDQPRKTPISPWIVSGMSPNRPSTHRKRIWPRQPACGKPFAVAIACWREEGLTACGKHPDTGKEIEKHSAGAKEAAEKGLNSGRAGKKHTSGAKARRLFCCIYGTLRLRSGQALKSCPDTSCSRKEVCRSL